MHRRVEGATHPQREGERELAVPRVARERALDRVMRDLRDPPDRGRGLAREDGDTNQIAPRALEARRPGGQEDCRFRKTCGADSRKSAVARLVRIIPWTDVFGQMLGAYRGAPWRCCPTRSFTKWMPVTQALREHG